MPRYTTFILGFTTNQPLPRGLSDEERMGWIDQYLVTARRAGRWKPESVRRLAVKLGIVRGLKAEAVSLDASGKGRHIVKPIEVNLD